MADPKRIRFCHSGPTKEQQEEAAEQLCEDCFLRWINGEPFIGCDLCPSPKWGAALGEAT